jgi:ribosomal protein S18 acetylase RimI-like enzyme
MNAWPALQTFFYDGWVLRFANGYTRRANSINPIYPSTIDARKKIGLCRRLYTARGLRTVFKMTREVYPLDLDTVLKNNGYIAEAETSVQIVPLETFDFKEYGPVRIVTYIDDSWIEGFFRMTGAANEHKTTFKSMLRNIMTPKCVAYIKDEDTTVACGLGVLEQDMIGLFDIVVGKGFRGRGYAKKIVNGILLWAKSEGARRGYLQVMVENQPAMALYRKLGFEEMYRYWYRVSE